MRKQLTHIAAIASAVGLLALGGCMAPRTYVGTEATVATSPAYVETYQVGPDDEVITVTSVPVNAEFGQVTNINELRRGQVRRTGGEPMAAALPDPGLPKTVPHGYIANDARLETGRQLVKLRVAVKMDGGGERFYVVPANFELHTGDRVRIQNGIIYRG